jgi:ribosome recycling factor
MKDTMLNNYEKCATEIKKGVLDKKFTEDEIKASKKEIDHVNEDLRNDWLKD